MIIARRYVQWWTDAIVLTGSRHGNYNLNLNRSNAAVRDCDATTREIENRGLSLMSWMHRLWNLERHFTSQSTSRKRQRTSERLAGLGFIEQFEARQLLTVLVPAGLPSIGLNDVEPSANLTDTDLPSVPALSSLPNAKAVVFLNFLGASVDYFSGKQDIVIPVWDTDLDPTTFSEAELEQIDDVWRRVAEDYAPFNINVTTVNPLSDPSHIPAHVTQINIGGDGAWYWGESSGGGVAGLGTFSRSSATSPAMGFVFDHGQSGTDFMSNVISHESGHTFGLQHQSSWDSGQTSNPRNNFGPNFLSGPLVGGAIGYHTQWWYGTSSVSAETFQDDFAVIAGNDQVGLRPDDVGATVDTAAQLVLEGSALTGKGLIGTESDVDAWSFTAMAGRIIVQVNTPRYTGNLSASVQLLDAAGQVLATSADGQYGNSQDQDLAQTTYITDTPGTYYVIVSNSGLEEGCTPTDHGFNVGTYRVTASSAPFVATEIALGQSTVSQKSGKAGPVAAGATIQGTDAQTLRWNQITVSITSGMKPGDVLNFVSAGKGGDRMSVKSGILKLGKRQIGTVTQTAGGIRVELNFGQKKADTEQLLRQVTFKSGRKSAGARQVSILLQDTETHLQVTRPVAVNVQ